MDQSKKAFVGQPTNTVLGMALEEIFYRMVMAADGVGPIYVGKVDQRSRFPDLSHPTQLTGEEFLEFMGAGANSNLISRAQMLNNIDHSFFSRRENVIKVDARPVNIGDSMVSKTLDIDVF